MARFLVLLSSLQIAGYGVLPCAYVYRIHMYAVGGIVLDDDRSAAARLSTLYLSFLA